jgi:hypothetical protein
MKTVYKTKLHTNSDYTSNQNNKAMIYGSKALLFKKLYEQLSEFLGSNLAVNKSLKAGQGFYYEYLCQERLTYDMANRILSLHKRTIKNAR